MWQKKGTRLKQKIRLVPLLFAFLPRGPSEIFFQCVYHFFTALCITKLADEIFYSKKILGKNWNKNSI
jgi:hypothetical protein